MNATASTKLVKPVPVIRRVIIYAILVPVFFLLGFVPMWLKSTDASRNLAETEHQLSVAQGQVSLAAIRTALDSTVIEAQQGNYEFARQKASDFFSALRAETDRGEASAFSPTQREALQPLLAQQDAIITLLARGSSASVGQLTNFYDSYLNIVNENEKGKSASVRP